MPEGDTLAQSAARLQQALAGARVERIGGSHRDAIRHGTRLVGSSVEEVTNAGKHLIMGFDNGWALRTHLRMTGSWHLYRRGERWQRSPGSARVVVVTETWEAVCFAAPTVQIAPADLVAARVAHLGPEAGKPGFDASDVVARARRGEQSRTAADLLLDQSVLSGVGNVFKAEVLFLEGVHPETAVGDLSTDTIRRMAERADRLLAANTTPGRRNTTGDPRLHHWVYGRAGDPCRRCGGRIVEVHVGTPARVTAWCPGCQPAP